MLLKHTGGISAIVLSFKVLSVTDGMEGVCVDPGEKGAILEGGGARPARRGKRRAVGLRQWRRIDKAEWLKTQETGSPHHQETFMHRVNVIVHCVIISTLTTITGIMFYCIICFRKINHLVANTICIHPLMYGKLCQAHFLLIKKSVTILTIH